MAAIPVCIPNNCTWDESSGKFQRDCTQPRTGLQLVDESLHKLRSVHGPVCVVSIAGPCRRGKSYILSRVFDQGDVFPLGHSFDPETMGIWMWVVPEKYLDSYGREFTVVLLDSEGIDAVGAEGVNDHAIFVLSVLLSSVLIYNSVGVPTRTDLEALERFQVSLDQFGGDGMGWAAATIRIVPCYVIRFLRYCSHIINICRRIQVIAGQTLDDETARKVFPSFVWLLRDVVLTLPKDVENLKKYFLEKVFKTEGRKSEKSGRVVDNILKYFPDFDAFPLSPPSSDAEVVQHLSDESRQKEINSSFLKGVEDFKQMLTAKLSPKQSFSGAGLVTGQALATLLKEYVSAVNSPGAVPIVQSAWDVVTRTRCTETLENAKAVYEGGMKDLMRDIRFPCDDKKIRLYHEEQLLAALTFFESFTEDIEVTARWIYLEELSNYADQVESVWLRDNNSQTEQECTNLMKSLRKLHLESVLSDLRNPDSTDFLGLEKRLLSAYEALDSNFRKEAAGSKSLRSNLAYIYELQHSEEMREHLAQLKMRKRYFEEIESERAVREAQAEETQKIRGANALLEERNENIERMIADAEKERVKEMKTLQRKKEEQMRLQQEQAQAAVARAREETAAEKEQYLRQQRQLQAQIDEARRKQQEQEQTISNLRHQLRRK